MTQSPVLVSGLTIVRNGVRLDYPFIEAIRSGLPICDEYVVVVGDSDDETLARLHGLNEPKLRIIETTWSPYVTPKKCALAQQTNVGLLQCRGRWCVYLQANEVLHEDSLPVLRGLMEEHAIHPDGFLEYVHDIDHSCIVADQRLTEAIARLPTGRRHAGRWVNGSGR